MGTTVTHERSDFRIKKENFDGAMTALGKVIDFEDYDIGPDETLDIAFEYLEWIGNIDQKTGDFINMEFHGEKLDEEDEIFKAIAPYVEAGSYIQMTNEHTDRWRWYFNGKTCIEQVPCGNGSIDVWKGSGDERKLFLITTKVSGELTFKVKADSEEEAKKALDDMLDAGGLETPLSDNSVVYLESDLKDLEVLSCTEEEEPDDEDEDDEGYDEEE